MLKEKKLIVANWKMNGKLKNYVEFVKKLPSSEDKEIVICPSYSMISILKSYANSDLKFGAQDCSEHSEGAFTGEVSAEMLIDIGCQYVIVGHSERRKYHNENLDIINNKIEAARKVGLKIIICIGENDIIRSEGNYMSYIADQINKLIINKSNPSDTIIAYEPIWAIGTGFAASIDQINEMHNFIGKMFEKKIKIIYGGSVNENNINEILKISGNSGVLIGNTSTNLEKFTKIINL